MPAEMREETKEIISRDLLCPTNHLLPQYMPVDVKPIILMGSGSIHLNCAAYDDNDDPQSNMPPARELFGSKFGPNPIGEMLIFKLT